MTTPTNNEESLLLPEPHAIKMFVGQIPKVWNENDVRVYFQEFGPIYLVNVLRDKVTKQSRGCCFITYYKRKSAIQAQNACHNLKTLPGMNHPLQMKPADNENRAERKIFVGMISKSFGELDLRQLFHHFGLIEECSILRDSNGTSRGCGFVTFSSKASALSAIKGMHHSRTLDGCSSPIVVKFADVKSKEVAAAEKSYVPMVQLLQGQQQELTAATLTFLATAGLAAGLTANTSDGSQIGYPNNSFGFPSQMEGPEGSNLFIYHLPQDFNDGDLIQTFLPFGTILSAKVFIDRATNLSKCFGFVSYDNTLSAHLAISTMNGFQIGPKRLKVQLKRAKDKPY